MKKLIKSIVPPIFLSLLKLISPSKTIQVKIYDSYEDAKNECFGAYENSNLLKVIHARVNNFKSFLEKNNLIKTDQCHINGIFCLMYAALMNNKSSCNVVDFGGGAGDYYFLAKKMFNGILNLQWTIVETEGMCQIVDSYNESNLKCISNTDHISSDVDLIIASGSLQYTPDPYEELKKLISLNANYLLISRCSLMENDFDAITIQKFTLSFNNSIPLPDGCEDSEISLPHTNMQKNKFEKILKNSYEVLLYINDDTGIVQTDNGTVVGGLYFCKKKR